MKTRLFRLAAAGFLGLALAAAPLSGSASAQGEERVATPTADRADDGFDWGWLGLGGLLGLAGLMHRDRDDRGHRASTTTAHPGRV